MKTNKTLKINEIFYSIQGEGLEIGLPTTFIRLSHCNIRCSWCDTKYAYKQFHIMNIDKILDKVSEDNCLNICITGGEPLLQDNVHYLINRLIENEYNVTLETNGSFNITKVNPLVHISMDYKLPSSKMEEYMLKSNLKNLKESDVLKLVVSNKEDFKRAIEISNTTYANIIIQPNAKTNPKLIRNIAKWILSNHYNHLRIGIQLHKLIWGFKKGV